MPAGFGIVHLAEILGGVALFVYGLQLASTHLVRHAGARLKVLFGLAAHNPWLAPLAGAIAAAIMQSSNSATALLVELTGGGLLTLGQALGVALGAGIGASMTVQIIAFRVEDYALFVVAVGVITTFLSRGGVWRVAGTVLTGFGLVFYGIHVMGAGFEPLRQSGPFAEALAVFAANPLLGILTAAAFTALIQAGAATIAIAMTLYAAGLLPLPGAVAIVIGANIGPAATAFFVGARVGRKGLQVAVGYLGLRLTAALLAALLFPWAVVAAGHLWTEPARQIANFHTLFNVVTSLLLAPLVFLYARAVRRLVPLPPEATRCGLRHVDLTRIAPASDALERARLDVAATAESAVSILQDAVGLVDSSSHRDFERLIERDDEIDNAVEILSIYLARIGSQTLSPAQARQRASLLGVLRSVERIGDLLTKDLAPAALKRVERAESFSIEGAQLLRRWMARLVEFLASAVQCMQSADRPPGTPISAEEAEAVSRQLYEAHYAQVRDGVRAAIETTSSYTDAVAVLRELHLHVGEVARAARESRG